jgi:pentatricopeptide repeat protein
MAEAYNIVQVMRKQFIVPNLSTYNSLMHLNATYGTKEDTIALFEYIQKGAYLIPDVVTYGCLASSFERHNDADGCLSLFNMLNRGTIESSSTPAFSAPPFCSSVVISPDSWIYTLVLRCLVRAGRWDDAFMALEQSEWWEDDHEDRTLKKEVRIKLPASLCNALFYMYCFKRNWGKAHLMLRNMKRKYHFVKIEFDTVELALKACLQFLGAIDYKNISAEHQLDDALFVTEELILGFQKLRGKNGRDEQTILKDMEPLFACFQAFATAKYDGFYGKARLSASIYFIGKELYSFPAHPTLLERICLECISLGDVVQAKRLFFEIALQAQGRVSPSLCNFMVSTLLTSGREHFEDAKHIFNHMRMGKYGAVQPDLQLYSCMIKHYAGDTLLEKELFNEMLEGLSLASSS